MNILAIETSCDETAAAVVHEGRWVRSNVVASQIAVHAKYGGIVPELASRQHITAIIPVLSEALEASGMSRDEIDAVGVTVGPGLAGSLLVGVNVAKTLAYAWDKPLIPVNHLEGHIYSNWLTWERTSDVQAPAFPAICLIVSGGHTELLVVHRHGVFEPLGRTLDDAAGEAFDKGARILGLGYPGGPEIQRAAEGAVAFVEFPRAWLGDSYDFSFSGLKTALLRVCEPYRKPDERQPLHALGSTSQNRGEPFPRHQPPDYRSDLPVSALAVAYQDAIVDVLVSKTVRAAVDKRARSVLVAGGVAANRSLRGELSRRLDVPLFIPALEFCTDNAAMIAGTAYHVVRRGVSAGWSLEARAQFPLTAIPGIRVIEHHASRA